MVKFLEGNGDFIDFGDEENEAVTCTCNECGATFEVGTEESPDECPSCGIEFDFGVEEG